MSLLQCKVYNDGSHFFALLPFQDAKKREGNGGGRVKDPVFEKYKEFVSEGKRQDIPKKQLSEHVKMRFLETAEDIIDDMPTDEDFNSFSKRLSRSLHAQRKRYDYKAFLNIWNWFITFTYADDKITYEDFEKKLRKALSNQHSRNEWLYMAAREEGDENGRKHFHVIANIKDGKMPGKLECRSHYSTKKRRMVYYTANTLFDRFGESDFQSISNPTERRNKIAYLVKYIAKQNGKLIYSRGIPDHIEMVIDSEQDIVCTYRGSGTAMKAVLADTLFANKEEKERIKKIKEKFITFEKEKTLYSDLEGTFFKETVNAIKFGIETVIFSFLKTENGRGVITDQQYSYGCSGQLVAC